MQIVVFVKPYSKAEEVLLNQNLRAYEQTCGRVPCRFVLGAIIGKGFNYYLWDFKTNQEGERFMKKVVDSTMRVCGKRDGFLHVVEDSLDRLANILGLT